MSDPTSTIQTFANTDKRIVQAVIAVLRIGLDGFGLGSVKVKQSYQPRQSGAEIDPTIYLHKITIDRWGWVGRKDDYNPQESQFDHIDVFYRAATWQVNGLVTQNVSPPSTLTASDIVECAADVLQTEATIMALSDQRIRMEHITQVRETYFLNDRERHQQNPSFDFTLTYMVNRPSVVPPVIGSGGTLHRI